MEHERVGFGVAIRWLRDPGRRATRDDYGPGVWVERTEQGGYVVCADHAAPSEWLAFPNDMEAKDWRIW